MESACRVYRPRDPRKTPLWALLDTLYERVKGKWEERFERKYGFWRGLADEAVARYLDCGDWNSGFARVKCRRCPEEFLVAFSCRGRGLCPSCGAKRAAELGAFLVEEVVYTRKGGQDTSEPAEDETIDAEEFVARVLVQIPDPRRHLVRY